MNQARAFFFLNEPQLQAPDQWMLQIRSTSFQSKTRFSRLLSNQEAPAVLQGVQPYKQSINAL